MLPPFWHQPNPQPRNAMRRCCLDALPAEADFAPGRAHEPHDRADRRRLAHAIAADEGHDLALVDAEGNAEEHLRMAITGLD